MKQPIHNGIFAKLFGLTLTLTLAANESECRAEGSDFDRGAELGRQQMAWIRAAEHRMYLALWEADRKEELKDHFIEKMWLSIIDLHGFTENPDALGEERDAATRILKEVVLHFYQNPRESMIPEGTGLTSRFTEGVGEEVAEEASDPKEREFLEDLAEKSEPLIEQLEGVFDGMLDEYEKREVETQLLVDKLITERFFPERRIEGAGIILKVPRQPGHSSSSSSARDVSFESETLNVFYETGHDLIINDVSYGTLSEGDVVDLRKPGYLFVNDVERRLFEGEHNQPGEATSDR